MGAAAKLLPIIFSGRLSIKMDITAFIHRPVGAGSFPGLTVSLMTGLFLNGTHFLILWKLPQRAIISLLILSDLFSRLNMRMGIYLTGGGVMVELPTVLNHQ